MRCQVVGITLLVNALLACVWISPACALTIQRLTLSEIRDQADLVIVGTVQSSSTRVGPAAKMVWTDYLIAAEETLLGEEAAALLPVSFAGGQAEGLDIGIPGMPHLETGQRYVLFLLPDDIFFAPTVGWGQGIYRVVDVDVDGLVQQVLISHDREPIEVTDEGGLSRGRPVAVKDGSLTWAIRARTETEASLRAPEPVVHDWAGKVIPQQILSIAVDEPVISSAIFADLEDLRKFLAEESQEENIPGGE